jgi:hypothetical protein
MKRIIFIMAILLPFTTTGQVSTSQVSRSPEIQPAGEHLVCIGKSLTFEVTYYQFGATFDWQLNNVSVPVGNGFSIYTYTNSGALQKAAISCKVTCNGKTESTSAVYVNGPQDISITPDYKHQGIHSVLTITPNITPSTADLTNIEWLWALDGDICASKIAEFFLRSGGKHDVKLTVREGDLCPFDFKFVLDLGDVFKPDIQPVTGGIPHIICTKSGPVQYNVSNLNGGTIESISSTNENGTNEPILPTAQPNQAGLLSVDYSSLNNGGQCNLEFIFKSKNEERYSQIIPALVLTDQIPPAGRIITRANGLLFFVPGATTSESNPILVTWIAAEINSKAITTLKVTKDPSDYFCRLPKKYRDTMKYSHHVQLTYLNSSCKCSRFLPPLQ